MELDGIFAWIAIVCLVGISLFQIALIAGAPWGEIAFGGQNKGSLPVNLRIGSAISVFVYLGVIGHFLAQLDLLPKLLDPGWNLVANWVIVGLFSIALVMNSITPSKKERAIWAPVALVLLIASLIIAL